MSKDTRLVYSTDPALNQKCPRCRDLSGTFVFALSGAMVGIRSRLDLFGVLVLSFAAANTGGIVRDLLMGATPPSAISDWKYVAVSFAAGLMTFFKFPVVHRLKSPSGF